MRTVIRLMFVAVMMVPTAMGFAWFFTGDAMRLFHQRLDGLYAMVLMGLMGVVVWETIKRFGENRRLKKFYADVPPGCKICDGPLGANQFVCTDCVEAFVPSYV